MLIASASKRWKAFAKNSSDTDRIEPPSETLDNSENEEWSWNGQDR